MKIGELVDKGTGERKYLDADERQAFKTAALYMEPQVKTFGLMIYYTGCRLSEALEVSPTRLDFEQNHVLFRTLKQSPDKPDKFRAVELPAEYMAGLESEYKARSKKGKRDGNKRLWSFTDRTGQKYIKKIMTAAGIEGKRATSRGLRHSMGVMLALNKTPINVIADILGHEFTSSTEIYLQILGNDRRAVISQVW